MKFETKSVAGIPESIHAMRNPMKSWDKSDSYISVEREDPFDEAYGTFVIGEKDLALSHNLSVIGPSDRKHLRQIMVWVDISAPLYWWKEFDTYRMGTTGVSESTMHKLASTPISIELFEEMANAPDASVSEFECYISYLEYLRRTFLETKDKRYWKTLIQMLPCSWVQMRSECISYEAIHKMVVERSNHKLTEWSVDFINWVKTLPYAEELIFFKEDKE